MSSAERVPTLHMREQTLTDTGHAKKLADTQKRGNFPPRQGIGGCPIALDGVEK